MEYRYNGGIYSAQTDRDPEHGKFGNRRVHCDDLFEVGRVNIGATRNAHVFKALDEAEEPIFIAPLGLLTASYDGFSFNLARSSLSVKR